MADSQPRVIQNQPANTCASQEWLQWNNTTNSMDSKNKCSSLVQDQPFTPPTKRALHGHLQLILDLEREQIASFSKKNKQGTLK